MRGFRIKRLKEDLTSHSGLALVGRALARSGLSKEADRSVPLRHGIAHGDVLGAYIGLLTLGKHDFGAVENQRKVRFFRRALGLRAVPSAPTLRQRFDGKAEEFLPLVEEASVNFLRGMGVAPGSLATGHVPLDCDVTPFDNSQTRKEGVSRTCHGTDGYAPMAAYPGREGYCVGFELRAGSQHCQKGTPAFLARVLARARRLAGAPILVRLDAGNDAIENIATLRKHNETDEAGADHIIEWNPRRNSALDWFRHAERRNIPFEKTRPGKQVAVFSHRETRRFRGHDYPLRRVMRVTRRTRSASGQPLLIPDYQVEGWWTSLDHSAKEIIALYHDHGTSEQFHSEFKSDLGVERLPSGKFATNTLVLACATLAYDILRWMGQTGLLETEGGPIRHGAERRRIRTVMQELMYLAARVIESGRRLQLGFGRYCGSEHIFASLYRRLGFP